MGIIAEALRTMESRQPGSDGARCVHRSRQAHYSFTGQPGSATQQEVYEVLLHLFSHKVDTNSSEQAITDLLLRMKTLTSMDAAMRDNLPTSFKAMLTALRKFGFPDNHLWEYDMCPCSHIYR